jgi:hypothetical protein
MRVPTILVLAGAIAFAIPCAAHAQRGGGHAGGFSGGGHAGGFSGGHAGGFSGGGFAGHSFSAPSAGFGAGGFQGRSFAAPRMNFMPGPGTSSSARFASAPRPYGFNGTRSPFGQMPMPAIRRAPYPGAGNNGGWSNQPYRNGNNQWHGGGHNGDHDGHHYRPPYYGGAIYSSTYGWPYYAGLSYWPWPYFGDWDSGYDSSPDTAYAGAQIQGGQQDQYPQQNPDQYYAPEPQQDSGRPAYQPGYMASPGVAISEPAVTIIYKDGHAEQVRNYALTPTKLLMMDNAAAGYSMQVPLSLIDLPATVQANRAAGVDFQLPVSD